MHFLCNFLGWISLYNFRRLLKKEPKIASSHEIKSRVFEKQFFDILSVQFFNLVVLNRFLMSNLYFMLSSKSLRILICHDFWRKAAKNDEKSSKWCDFHPKWWQIKILRLLEFNMKYEFDIRILFRTTKLNNYMLQWQLSSHLGGVKILKWHLYRLSCCLCSIFGHNGVNSSDEYCVKRSNRAKFVNM